ETDLFITLTPREQWDKGYTQAKLEDDIRELFYDLPGQKIQISQPIGQRIDEMISGVRGAVAVKIFGDDFAVLGEKGKEVQAVLNSIPGAEDVNPEPLTDQPVLQVQMRQDQLARYGVSAREALELVEVLSGKRIGDVIEEQLRFPLAVW